MGILAAALSPLPSYSSWSTSPHPVTSTQERALAEGCHASGPTLVDARGRTAVLLETSPRMVSVCFATVPGEKDDGAGASADITRPRGEDVTVDGVRVWHVGPSARPGGAHAATVLVAHLAASVVRADVVTPVGNVRASLRDGAVLAWWPGRDARGVVITGRGRDGHVVSQVVLP